MAKLFTSHDRFNIHKGLGVVVLLHFLFRLLQVLYGLLKFDPLEDAWTGSSRFIILVHLALSWSSLLIPIPEVRNFTQPMIWPEFRAHSITFATRHVLGVLLALFVFPPRSAPPPPWPGPAGSLLSWR